MHILYLHQYFVPPDGIGGTRSYEMARRFVAAGHRVTIITSGAYFPASYELESPVSRISISGIDLIVLSSEYSNHFSFVRRAFAFVQFAFRAAKTAMSIESVDVVFASSTPLTIAIPGILAKLKHSCPMVFEVRDLWPDVPVAMGVIRNPVIVWLAKQLERVAYKNSTNVIALSPGMAEGVSRVGYPNKHIHVIPNSCDLDLFDVPDSSGRAFLDLHPHLKGAALVTYPGTLGMVNGIDYFVDIASQMLLVNPDVKFLIVGDGKKRDEVLQHAEQLGVLGANLWYMEPLPKDRMPDVFSASTVLTSFVIDIPELWNNSANKFFDCLASRRPILINHLGWQAEFIAEHGVGLVVPPRDEQRSAKLLSDFLSSPELLLSASNAASHAAREVFNRDKLAVELLGIIEASVGNA